MAHDLSFEVDINVINHLGVGLYSSTPAALAELVANSWDAEAHKVEITIDSDENVIVIEDDGHGMSVEELKAKFLTVGYSRRHSGTKGKSKNNLRYVMGRKGIGKLAIFALAGSVQITTQSQGEEPVAFEINVEQFKKDIENKKAYKLQEIEDDKPFLKGYGTRIALFDVPVGLNKTPSFLRTRLARRFAVLGSDHEFQMFINDKEVTLEDRQVYKNIQFLWSFDESTKQQVRSLSQNIASIKDNESLEDVPCISDLNSVISVETGDKEKPVEHFEITGYIASVEKPSQLGKGEDSANMLSIFANGKVFAENLFASDITSARHYQNYLVGEIHADFLDRDEIDRATANRESIKKDDSRYKALLAFIRLSLLEVDKLWDEWRIALGLEKGNPLSDVIIEWLEGLQDKRDIKTAKKLVSGIQKATFYEDEVKNLEVKKRLLSNAIVGFEKLRMTNRLDELEEVTDIFSPEFAAIFSTLSDLEETAFAEITRERLAVITRFKDIVDNTASLEKVAHKYLFDNLWLLDPTWDRVTGRAEMEKTLTTYLKNKYPDSTGARLDISYRTSSSRHVVVELKKPSKTVTFDEVSAQVRKYRIAITEYYKQKEPNKAIPELDIFVLVKKTPVSFDESDREALQKQRATILTYEQLINDAYNAYEEYLQAHKRINPIETTLTKLRSV